jgi:hypothetical protein
MLRTNSARFARLADREPPLDIVQLPPVELAGAHVALRDAAPKGGKLLVGEAHQHALTLTTGSELESCAPGIAAPALELCQQPGTVEPWVARLPERLRDQTLFHDDQGGGARPDRDGKVGLGDLLDPTITSRAICRCLEARSFSRASRPYIP